MMTIEEAIKHCEENVCDNTECSLEHKQLAEWLKELQELKSNNEEMATVNKTTPYMQRPHRAFMLAKYQTT